MHGAWFIAEKSARASRESQMGRNESEEYPLPAAGKVMGADTPLVAIHAHRPYIHLYERLPRLDIDAVSELEN